MSQLAKSEKYVPQISLEMYEVATPAARMFYPDIKEGYVCKVYDGDTIHVVSAMSVKYCRCHDKTDPYCGHGYLQQYFKFKIRINGIDTPEIKTKDKGAMEARHVLTELILGKIIQIFVVKTDKYGRLLCEIYTEDTNGDWFDVGKWLVKNGYAVEYDGGKKQVFEKESGSTN